MSAINNSFSCNICLEGAFGEKDLKHIQKMAFQAGKITFDEKEVKEDSMEAVATQCNHVFHDGCLRKWILEFKDKTTPANCPVCRTPLAGSVVVVQAHNQNISLPHIVGLNTVHGPLLIDEVHNILNVHHEVNYPMPSPAVTQASIERALAIGELILGVSQAVLAHLDQNAHGFTAVNAFQGIYPGMTGTVWNHPPLLPFSLPQTVTHGGTESEVQVQLEQQLEIETFHDDYTDDDYLYE